MSSVDGVTKGRFHGRRGEVNRWKMPLNWHFEKISRTSTPLVLLPGQRLAAFRSLEISD